MCSAHDLTVRPRRVDLRQPAVLINSDGTANKVLIVDMSAQGFCVEVPDELHKGEEITLRVEPSEDMPGRICWALGNRAGGAFLTPANAFAL